MRISELADQADVPVSTIRYYERIGLLAEPARTISGYREYDDTSATQLLFVTRSRKLGLTCQEIVALLPIWGGTDCSSTKEQVTRLIDDKKAEIAARIKELNTFAEQLDSVHALLQSTQPPQACRADLTCCVPSGPDSFVALEGVTASLGERGSPPRPKELRATRDRMAYSRVPSR